MNEIPKQAPAPQKVPHTEERLPAIIPQSEFDFMEADTPAVTPELIDIAKILTPERSAEGISGTFSGIHVGQLVRQPKIEWQP